MPRDGGLRLDSDGFVLPPPADADDFVWWKTDVVSFEELCRKPCLALLGEPGIGKSFAIEDAVKRTRSALKNSNAKIIFRNLAIYNGDQHLVEDIFRGREIAGWRSEGGDLHLFLDSFDECLIRVDTLAALLADQLERLGSISNVFVRIACRTAEWSTSLEAALQRQWGADSVGIYELAPLTKTQVLEAAKARLSDGDSFLKATIDSEVVSFATKPLTLDLLMRIWRTRGGSLPPTQKEIYEQGCLELCTETQNRQTPKLRRHLTPEQRLAVASHMAAGTFFCNRTAIWTGSRESEKPEPDISISDLANGSVSVGGEHLAVTATAIRETLDSGLFTSRGPDRLSWAHQTYGEFLAARYIAEEGMALGQKLDLLSHPLDAERKLIPQLQEVSAWAAGSDRELFVHLLKVQPEVLLRSDVATSDAATKANLVDSLLSAIAANTLHTSEWWAMRKRYSKLRQGGLSGQLRRWITDRNVAGRARVEAITIVDACDITDLLSDLADKALDRTEDQSVREMAAGVCSKSDDVNIKKRLRPLALGDSGNDPNGDLRGAGLKSCWPTEISAKELFGSLKPPPRGLSGLYNSFITNDLLKHLSRSDFPAALEWAQNEPEKDDYISPYGGLVHRILDKASEYLDDEKLLAPFARTLIARLRKHDFSTYEHDAKLPKILELRPDLRRKLVRVIVTEFREPKADSPLLHHRGLALITSDDVSWLIEQMLSASGPKLQRAYAHLITWVFRPENAAAIDLVISASQIFPGLTEAMPYWLKPTILDSDEARKAKQSYTEQKGFEEERRGRERRPLSPTPGEHILHLLQQFEAGNSEAWWQLCVQMEIEDMGAWCKGHHHVDVRHLVGWENASEQTRARIVAAAPVYLRSAAPNEGEWFSQSGISYRPAVAGLRALVLLAHEAPAQFEALSDSIWKTWMPAILRCHFYEATKDEQLIVSKAFERVPEAFIEWAIRVLNEEEKEGQSLWIIRKLPETWSEGLGSALLNRARENKLKPQCKAELLTALLEHKVPRALELLRSLIPANPPREDPLRQEAVLLARLLMLFGEKSDWVRIQPLFDADPAFGRDLMAGFTHEFDRSPGPILKTLNEPQVGALWEWMVKQYPPEEDPDRSGGGLVRTRDSMAYLRNGLLLHLAETGTAAGCDELSRLIKKHGSPQFHWLQSVLLRAKDQMRRKTWAPPKPKDLFRLAQQSRARLVQSPVQLLDVILDSLNALQERLSGERQLAQFLWDGRRPKREESLSDWVAAEVERDLQGRGIVLGREVQIHRIERTDIHVTAITHDQRTGDLDTVKVIIETKGAWNPKLKTAMKDQLVDRYLEKNQCQDGIYLVGWFPKEIWDKADSRRGKVSFANLADLEAFLAKQAESLSMSGMVIAAKLLDFSITTPGRHKQRKSGHRTGARPAKAKRAGNTKSHLKQIRRPESRNQKRN